MPALVEGNDIEQAQEMIRQTHVREEVIGYVRRLIEATRRDDSLSVGASPRAGLMLLMGAKSLARFAGRDFVTPDDIKRAFFPGLGTAWFWDPTPSSRGRPRTTCSPVCSTRSPCRDEFAARDKPAAWAEFAGTRRGGRRVVGLGVLSSGGRMVVAARLDRGGRPLGPRRGLAQETSGGFWSSPASSSRLPAGMCRSR